MSKHAALVLASLALPLTSCQDAAVPAGDSNASQAQPSPANASTESGKRSPANLTGSEKNRLAWEWDRQSGPIGDALGERYESRGSMSVKELANQIDREYRQPIAEKYGLTHSEAKQIFDDSLNADWATDSPPDDL